MTTTSGVNTGMSVSDYLQRTWIEAGGNASNALLAGAVGQAENSSGDPRTVSAPNSNGTVDVGLWQINSSHIGETFSMPAQSQGGPGVPKTITIESIQWLQDPTNNARAAIAISNNGGDWHPWCTAWSDNACGTRGGSYLGAGSAAVANFPGGSDQLSKTGINNATPDTPSLGSGGATAGAEHCLIRIPQFSIFPGAHVGPYCLFSTSTGRALIGAGTLVLGSLGLVGVALALGRSATRGAVPKLRLPGPAGRIVPDAGTAAGGGDESDLDVAERERRRTRAREIGRRQGRAEAGLSESEFVETPGAAELGMDVSPEARRRRVENAAP